MAKKPEPKSAPAPKAAPAKAAAAKAPAATKQIDKVAKTTTVTEAPISETPVRKTVMPTASPAGAAISVPPAPKANAPKPAAKAAPVTYERIAERAYHISQSGSGGSEYDNWLRAEAELHAESKR